MTSKTITIAGWALVLLLVVITGLITVHRAHSGSNDFDTFYHAGRSVYTAEGLYYEGEYYQEVSDRGPFLYPPFAACVLAAFAVFPLSFAAFFWNAFNLGLFVLIVMAIFDLLGFKPGDWRALWQRAAWPDRLVALIMSLAILLDNLTMAQINILVFSLTLSALWLWRHARPWLAGLMLAAAIMIKMTPAIFVLYWIVRRQWKMLGGVLIGLLVFTAVLPSLCFGFEKNLLYHRQWLGRTVKPFVVEVQAALDPEAPHPLKQSAAMTQHNRLTGMLVAKNQSLEAALTRLLLKDRARYGYEPYPIYVARKYEKMPVLFGGLPQQALRAVIRLIEAAMVIGLIYLWHQGRKRPPEASRLAMGGRDDTLGRAAEWGLLFLTMTLLAPWARSHQFVSWLFAYGTLLSLPKIPEAQPWQSRLLFCGRFACVLYLLQGVPYGKAAGLGMWANLTLWTGFFVFLCQLRFTAKLKDSNRVLA